MWIYVVSGEGIVNTDTGAYIGVYGSEVKYYKSVADELHYSLFKGDTKNAAENVFAEVCDLLEAVRFPSEVSF